MHSVGTHVNVAPLGLEDNIEGGTVVLAVEVALMLRHTVLRQEAIPSVLHIQGRLHRAGEDREEPPGSTPRDSAVDGVRRSAVRPELQSEARDGP